MPTSLQPGRPRPGRGRGRPQEVDQHVGARLRQLRLLLGLTQQELAARAGVTYQQVHKYEKGLNRLTVGRLHAIATALEVEVTFFFAGLENQPDDQLTAHQKAIDRLAHDFLRLPSRAQQEALAVLARALATIPPATADQPARRDPRSGTDANLC